VPSRTPLAFAVLIAGVAAPSTAGAQPSFDRWSEPNPGLRYLHRTTSAPCTIHAVVADLRIDGVAVITTPYDARWQTVGAFGRNEGAAVAVNGGFWGRFARAEGVTAGGGRVWPSVEDDEEHGFFAVGRDGRAWISPPEELVLVEEIPARRLLHAVSGRPMLVREAAVDRSGLDALDYAGRRHPRTAVGVSRDGLTVILVVVDGRQEGSRGATLYELAELMVELGAHRAINLDGGGSSAMWIAREGGVVNVPSGGRWEAGLGLGAVEEPPARERRRTAADGLAESYVRGVEREVLNHVAVLASAPAASRLHPRDAFDDMPRLERPPPRPPLLTLGSSREVLYPLAYGACALAPLLVVGLVIHRRRRRRLVGTERC
jgi:hypothetical protein